MSDLFKDANYGDRFLTRGGEVAILWYYHVGNDVVDQVVLIHPNAKQILVDGDGKDMNEPFHATIFDIVSKIQEPKRMKFRLSDETKAIIERDSGKTIEEIINTPLKYFYK